MRQGGGSRWPGPGGKGIYGTGAILRCHRSRHAQAADQRPALGRPRLAAV